MFASIHINREKAIGLFAAVALHTVVLYFLLSYQIIPPPSKALMVLVSCINPAVPAKISAPPTCIPASKHKPPTPEPDALRTVIPETPPLLVSEAPVISPSEPIAPPPPVTKVPVAPVPVNAPVVHATVGIDLPVVGGVQVQKPVQLSGELSVSCTERSVPAYPKQSVRFGEQGKTVLQVELDESGRVVNAVVVTKSGYPRLDDAAINAVKQWRCSPAKRNGISVRSVALQPFNFTLKGR
ncbi:MAG: TonB family protein [Desulfuromonadaceae bacterium]